MLPDLEDRLALMYAAITKEYRQFLYVDRKAFYKASCHLELIKSLLACDADIQRIGDHLNDFEALVRIDCPKPFNEIDTIYLECDGLPHNELFWVADEWVCEYVPTSTTTTTTTSTTSTTTTTTTTKAPVVQYQLKWAYSDVDPYTTIINGNDITYQFQGNFNRGAVLSIDFSNAGSGKYLVIKQPITEAAYTNWEFNPQSNFGKFTGDPVFRNPVVVGAFRYYVSRSSFGVTYSLNDKMKLTTVN